MRETRFVARGSEGPAFDGLPFWMSSLLRARGVATGEEARRFLNPRLEELSNPFLLQGMGETVALLREAIRRGDRILVYGDYDADGVCASSILMETLHEEGAELAYRIPSRHREGYGLNPEAVREIAGNARLLITVDCGISNHAEVALAKELGLTVIVTDHHQPPETLPAADAVMDPLLGDAPCPYLCGAGVALKICQALQGMDGVKKRLDLAALATVADVVPLRGENRIIVREGLRAIAASPRPGMQALLAAAGLDNGGKKGGLTAEDAAFRLAPRLNAAGRLGDAKLGVHLLLTPDPAKAVHIAGMLEDFNRQRQALERSMTAEAVSQLKKESLGGRHAAVVSGEGWNPGLIGLTAGRLCERLHLPVIALSLQGETAVGSCRSIPGVNIFESLRACGDLLLRFGGHEQAAGLTVETAKIPLFRERLEQVIAASAAEEIFLPSMAYDLAVPFSTWGEAEMELLSQLEPTGCGNPPPLFLLREAEVRDIRSVGADGSHLKLTLLDEDFATVEGIAFGQGAVAAERPERLNLLYRPVYNEFRGRRSIQAQIAALNPVR